MVIGVGLLSIILMVVAITAFMENIAQDNKKKQKNLHELQDKNTKLQLENKLLQLNINRLKEKKAQADDKATNP